MFMMFIMILLDYLIHIPYNLHVTLSDYYGNTMVNNTMAKNTVVFLYYIAICVFLLNILNELSCNISFLIKSIKEKITSTVDSIVIVTLVTDAATVF